MSVIKSVRTIAVAAILLSHTAVATEFEYSGKVGVEQRHFVDDSQYTNQFDDTQLSFLVNPELYWQWNDGDDSVTFQPFYRYDSQDDERTHFDIRELSYLHVGDDWELKAGIRKEYWGVTEFQHLVDVINQTDGVDSFDGEQKLGQQMVNVSLVKDWGIVDLYLLPGFRERTFSGEEGRLRGPLTVDNNNVSYESSAGENHLDFAARWTHSMGDFDVGAYWFHGTNRDPQLTATQEGEQQLLQQYYNQMEQLGFDLQATKGDFLWKFETIFRSTSDEDFWATQAGFEYTHVGIFDSAADLGLLLEHSWDSRGEGDDNSAGAAMQNDLFFGSRIALNDIQSTELLLGIGTDLQHSATMFMVEASRRLGESFKASLDVRILQSSDSQEALYYLRNDDHLGLTLEWYF